MPAKASLTLFMLFCLLNCTNIIIIIYKIYDGRQTYANASIFTRCSKVDRIVWIKLNVSHWWVISVNMIHWPHTHILHIANTHYGHYLSLKIKF